MAITRRGGVAGPPTPAREPSAFERHKALTLVLVNLALLAAALGALEVYARLTAGYDIDYYAGAKSPGVHQKPYGPVKINSMGFADDEFDLASTKPRVGYVGDSVNFGVGAGYGYRVSDILKRRFPAFEHWNLGAGVGTGLGATKPVERADMFKLGTVVYLLNLNDLEELQDAFRPGGPHPPLGPVRRLARASVDHLRTESYAYNYARFGVKTLLQRLGYEASGYAATELYPDRYANHVAGACEQINRFYEELKARGVDYCVIILPYEMQVSRDAAARYRALGFGWEDGFEDGSTQEHLRRCLAVPHVYDARAAFDRDEARIGEYFVYDKGDKVDWNHPNRAGHARIAEGFARSGACGFLERARTAGAASLLPRPGTVAGSGSR
jgi:hypothetical protein